VIVLDKGKLFCEGTPYEVFSKQEALEEIRLAVPNVVRLSNALRKAGIAVPENVLREEELAEALNDII
jgi:energy-coupling factor transport system ATP-binding protein